MIKFKRLFLAFGAVCFALSAYQYSIGNDSLSWSSVDGVIKSSTIRSLRSPGPHSSNIYEPYVEYIFVSEGKEYRGNQLILGVQTFASKAPVRQLLEKYPPGQKVKVYHELFNPENSVLERGVNLTFFFMLLGSGVFFMLFGLFFNNIVKASIKWIMP